MKRIKNRKGIGYVDSGVKILIAVVIGTLLLVGLYSLGKNVILKNTSERIEAMFDYGQENAAYGTRYQSSERVGKNGDLVIISEMMYPDYDHITVDGNTITEQRGVIYVTDSDPGCAFLIMENSYIRTVSKGTHTVRFYDKDGNYSESTFEKYE